MFPVLYQSEYLSIQTLWLFVCLALLSASYLAVHRLKRRRVNFTFFIEHSTRFFLIALVSARFIYFLSNTNAYFPRFDLRTLINFVSIWDQGLSLWGGIFAFFLALTWSLRKNEENIWRWYDALIVPLLAGIAIGAIGAFLGGTAYGSPTDLPWGVTYQSANVKYTVPIHPVQLYLIPLIGLLLLSKKWLKTHKPLFEEDGATALYLATGFSLIYFMLEFLRGDDTLLILGTIRFPMILSGIFFLIGAVRFAKMIKHYKPLSNESPQTTH